RSQARADGCGPRAGKVQALLPERDPRPLQVADRCAPLLERGANRVFAVRGGNLRQDSGMDSRARPFRRAGLGRRLRDCGRQLRSTAGEAGPVSPPPSRPDAAGVFPTPPSSKIAPKTFALRHCFVCDATRSAVELTNMEQRRHSEMTGGEE